MIAWIARWLKSPVTAVDEACEAAYLAGAKAEREACAQIADARAMRCEAKTATAEDADEVTELRSLAWQFSVLAAEMRKRSNAEITGRTLAQNEADGA